MIKNRQDLKKYINVEIKLYFKSKKDYIHLMLLKDHYYEIWKFVRALRHMEFHQNTGHKLRYYLWQRKKNKLGARLGLTIWPNTCESGLMIWHYGSVIINGHSKIGKNCKFHGMNCIGNKGNIGDVAPIIGNNVDIGIGAVIIGDVQLADDIKVGANAVVTKSCLTKGAILVGVPAHEISSVENER